MTPAHELVVVERQERGRLGQEFGVKDDFDAVVLAVEQFHGTNLFQNCVRQKDGGKLGDGSGDNVLFYVINKQAQENRRCPVFDPTLIAS